MKAAQLQARGDFADDVLVNELHAEQHRRRHVEVGGGVIARGDRHGGDDGRTTEKSLQAYHAVVPGAWRHAVGAGRDNGVALIAGAPALKIERRHQVGLDRVQPVRVDAATSEHCIDELI